MRTHDDWDLPERSLEPPEPNGLMCDQCGEAIDAGESYIRWHMENYCQDCAAEAVRDELDRSGFQSYMRGIADIMKFDVLEAYSG